ncbi:hypothetical protein SAMN02745823_03235 [Sporobacter termitidis DSM 10068]|uniref:Heavy-metal chelation n=1 Tax=Sporobacter termitidis DSM 10068 TaxID=1123282 RepID=A0A1M5Z4R9_9FIRM|nr:DUF364 domain-containing protein [Sporobacter termitidis]SHI19256.1 hypothetical protein SAMN02745823_03235 [Sporobacter termitidis DSM 10068]
MWEIYDALIGGIPEELTADRIVCGRVHTIVANALGAGFSYTLDDDTRLPVSSGDLTGKPLREVAALIKSWNFPEAAIGHAAINSYYNAPSVARANGIEVHDVMHKEDRVNDPFITSQNDVKGKKVAVLGHFPYLETFFEPVCDLSIIEWEPTEQGEYPFSSCEYILPVSDFIYISCRSLLDKTFPRLLELSKNARRVVLVGPATTMAPYLLTLGISDLSGFVVKDAEMALRITAGAENARMSRSGQKVSLKEDGAAHVL